MRAATRFHDDEFHISIDEPALELTTRQATALDYPPGFVGHRQLENVLCHVHRHGCSIHLGLLLSFMLKPPKASAGTMIPNKTREESIPSIERTASSKKLASRRRSCRTFGEERGRLAGQKGAAYESNGSHSCVHGLALRSGSGSRGATDI